MSVDGTTNKVKKNNDSNALARSKTDMGRKHQRERQGQGQGRSVLFEEEYTSTLDGIVERDYFPELPLLRRQAAVFERRAVGDIAGAVAIRRAARQLEQHELELAEQEQIEEQDCLDLRTATKIRQTARPLHRETVTGFHARVTSEDNHAFASDQATETNAHQEFLLNVFDDTSANIDTNSRNAITTRGEYEGDSPLLLASDKFSAPLNRIEASQWKTAGNTSSNPRNNSLFFSPKRQANSSNKGTIQSPTHQEKPTQATTATIETNCDTIDGYTEPIISHLMLPPPMKARNKLEHSSNENSLMSLSLHQDTSTAREIKDSSQSTVLSKHQLVEYTPKYTTERRIEPSQTRFPSSTATAMTIPTTSIASFEDNYTIGTGWATGVNDMNDSHVYSTDASTTDLDAPLQPIAIERAARVQRTLREQDTLVTMTPLIVPGNSSIGISSSANPHHSISNPHQHHPNRSNTNRNQSPIMTWGTVASTPMILGSSGGSREGALVESFRVPEEPTREQAVRLQQTKNESIEHSERNEYSPKSCNNKKKKRKVHLNNLPNLGSLTPAALSLLERTTSSNNQSSLLFQHNNKHKRPLSVRSTGAFAAALRMSYKSTPLRDRGKRKTTNSSKRHRTADHDHVERATPRIHDNAHTDTTKNGTIAATSESTKHTNTHLQHNSGASGSTEKHRTNGPLPWSHKEKSQFKLQRSAAYAGSRSITDGLLQCSKGEALP